MSELLPLSSPDPVPEHDNSQTSNAERDPSPDQLVEQFLGEVAVRCGFHEQEVHSGTFDGLPLSREQVERALAVVRFAEKAPGVSETNKGLVSVRDWETLEHQYRVAILAVAVAARDDASQDEIFSMAVAGLIHDNGKANQEIQAAVRKGADEPWTEADRLAVNRHPILGGQTARDAGIEDRLVLYLTETHHQDLRDDKTRGVSAYGTPAVAPDEQTARLQHIFSACDYFDARANPRVYQKSPLTAAEVLTRMRADLDTYEDIVSLFEEEPAVEVAA